MRRGFTLIETIFTCLLLGFLVLTIFNLYPSSFIAIKRGEGVLQADAISQGVLEDMRSRPFETIRDDLNPAFANVVYGGTAYQTNVTVFNVTGANPNYLVACNVRVSWNLQNHTKQVVHEAHFANVRR